MFYAWTSLPLPYVFEQCCSTGDEVDDVQLETQLGNH